jgi:hypothetical protein
VQALAVMERELVVRADLEEASQQSILTLKAA